MIDFKNKSVKLFFKTGLTAEGIILDWTEKELILKSSESSDLLYIFDPQQNIMMIKIKNSESKKEIVMEEEILKEPTPNLQAKKLVELRKLEAEMQRQTVAKRLRTFEISNVKDVQYANPSFIYGPQQKSSGSPRADIKRLRNLLPKPGQIR